MTEKGIINKVNREKVICLQSFNVCPARSKNPQNLASDVSNTFDGGMAVHAHLKTSSDALIELI
jgi:hypothetical protein